MDLVIPLSGKGSFEFITDDGDNSIRRKLKIYPFFSYFNLLLPYLKEKTHNVRKGEPLHTLYLG